MHRLPVLCAIAGTLALGIAAPAADAASRSQIIRDCADDGRLSGKYTQAEIRDARANIPADIDEYSDCRDVLRRAEVPDGTDSTGGGGGGGGGGTTGAPPSARPGLPAGSDGRELAGPKSKAEWDALTAAQTSGETAQQVGERAIRPGSAGLVPDGGSAGLPTPILIVLILAGLAGLTAAGLAGRKRVLDRRPT